jgi:hypothetical protein
MQQHALCCSACHSATMALESNMHEANKWLQQYHQHRRASTADQVHTACIQCGQIAVAQPLTDSPYPAATPSSSCASNLC